MNFESVLNKIPVYDFKYSVEHVDERSHDSSVA